MKPRHFGSKKPSRTNMRAVVAQIIAGATKPLDAKELARCYGLPLAEIERMMAR